MVNKVIKSFDDTEIFYRIKKQGKDDLPFLFFIHGWPHNHTVWNKELDFFERKGYSTVAMDLRGHGKSGMPEKIEAYSLDNFAKDVHEILVQEKIKRAVFIGHSFGGMVSLSHYSLFPKKVLAIVLIDSIYENPLKHSMFTKYFNLTPFTEHILRFVLEEENIQKKHFPYVDFSKFRSHDDFFYWFEGERETPVKSVLACLEAMIRFDGKKLLRRIDVPTLIIEGEKDTITAVTDVKKMAEAIKRSELVLIKGAAHDTNITRPRIIAKNILRFIESHLHLTK